LQADAGSKRQRVGLRYTVSLGDEKVMVVLSRANRSSAEQEAAQPWTIKDLRLGAEQRMRKYRSCMSRMVSR
jgi:hypothetical protein